MNQRVAEDGRHYEIKQGKPVYERKEKASPNEPDAYFLVRNKTSQVFEQNMFFPRMWDNAHAQDYEQIMGGIEGHDSDGVKMPTQMENIRFFLSYQCNFMYWRYFLWNFAGSPKRRTRIRRTRTWKLDYRYLFHR